MGIEEEHVWYLNEEVSRGRLEILIEQKKAETDSPYKRMAISVVSKRIPRFSREELEEMSDTSAEEIRTLLRRFPNDSPSTTLIRAALFIHTIEGSRSRRYRLNKTDVPPGQIRVAFRFCLSQCVLYPSSTMAGLYYRTAEEILDRAKKG